MNWRKKIKIKHLLTDSEEHEKVQEAMSKISDVLSKHSEFRCHIIIEKLRKMKVSGISVKPYDMDRIINLIDKVYAGKIVDLTQ